MAEGHILADPRAACFHARFALESLVHWLYRHDTSLHMPYDRSLGALLHEPSFQNLVPQVAFQKARVIQRQGNRAVHEQRPVRPHDAMQVVKELHHLCYWVARTYFPDTVLQSVAFDKKLVPQPLNPDKVVPRQELEELEFRLAKQSEDALKKQQERDELDAQIQKLRQELEETRATTAAEPDTHDYSEAETRRYLIDLDLKRAGWPLDQKRDQEYEVTGMPNNKGIGFVDYVLWGDDGKPLAAVEAKRSTIDPEAGRQQAKLYADCLEAMHGQRPVIFYTNGYETFIWDDKAYPPRKVAGFYSKDELQSLVLRRGKRDSLSVTQVKDEIAGRYYQKRAIGSIADQFAQSRRKALLVMATGTGKTRTSIALVDVLQRAGWVKRALFLADRISLVNQAVGAFKTHLPESSPVNLVTEKDKSGRVYVCTYPTMMGLIDKDSDRFGIGHFDLIVIDEAHRSVYQKYSAIFRYFDSLLVGLTATPREQVDKNTYELFDLEPGVPTDAYELEKAVSDGFLVPPKVSQVDLRFPREGISYDDLTEDEKAEWEGLDWGDDGEPDRVNASAINSWLFNRDTVDKALKYLMENGHRVEGGDRLAKTILFARNHDHAAFVEERFNHHYPELHGQFARVIDNQAKYPQSLIDAFSLKDDDPHIAISVDMLDTGIDVPEVANLVFFKPVYSKIKFWQMVGRGTRLCPDLFGPGLDKEDFRVFDFCFNFDFFKESPDGIEGGGAAPLGTRLFWTRVELIGHLQVEREADPDAILRRSVSYDLHAEVASMNKENFLVRERLETVERFQQADAWDHLSEGDRQVLQSEVAGLPSAQETDEIEARMFDLTVLKLQLASVQGDQSTFETLRQRVVELASLLEEKQTIPAVKLQLGFLAEIQEAARWEDMDVNGLEDLRLRMRGLMAFLDRRKKTIVYTDFTDEVMGVRKAEVIHVPTMTGPQYEKKVRDYLRNHQDHLVIHRLRSNQPLTEGDLKGLEQSLKEIGQGDGERLLTGLLERSSAPSLAYLVRSMVGMDRSAAQEAFSEFLNDRDLSPNQIRFVEMVIDQLTSRGVLDPAELYEAPFTDFHAGGPEALFSEKENVIGGVFRSLEKLHAGITA